MAQYQPYITVITVCYNAADTIERTIKNVIEQNNPFIEYIIIDGGSSDGTADIINKYSRHLKHFLSEPDRGIYDAMNKGWALANTDSYIMYLGAGDTIISMPSPESFIDTDVLYGDVWIGEAHLFRSKHNFMLKLGNTIHHQAQLVRKMINPEPPFALQYKIYADFNFNQQLLLKGAKFRKDPSFIAFALEGGISFKFNKTEPLTIVGANFGGLYVMIANFYYFLKNGKL